MLYRDALKKRATKSSDPTLWDKFKRERNRINNILKKGKADYYRSQINENIGNPKAIWNTINQLTHRKLTNNGSISEIIAEGVSYTSPSDVSDVLNNHFISVGPKLASNISNKYDDFESYITQATLTFQLEHTTANTFHTLLQKLSPHKATGLDNKLQRNQKTSSATRC